MTKLNEGSRISLDLDNLNIWTDNPRFEQRYSETDAITMLFITVTERKMFDLIKDIINYGLQINESVIVVKNKNLFDVYDGNRRVAAIKSILNPNLVNDISIRNNLINLLKDLDISELPNVLEVVQTSEQVAKELILRKHGPQDSGSSLQNWSTWSRDKFLYEQLNTQPQNKYAFIAIKDLGFNTYKEFNLIYKIEYTNLNRILGVDKVQNYFQELRLKSFDLYRSLLSKFISKSLKVQSNSNISFSRYFNDSNSIIILFDSFILDINESKIPEETVISESISPMLNLGQVKSIIDTPGETLKFTKSNSGLLYDNYKKEFINIGPNINSVFDEMKKIDTKDMNKFPICFLSLMRIAIDTAATDFIEFLNLKTDGTMELAYRINLCFNQLTKDDFVNVTFETFKQIKKFIKKELLLIENGKIQNGPFLVKLHGFVHKTGTINDLNSNKTYFNDYIIPFIIALSNHSERIRKIRL